MRCLFHVYEATARVPLLQHLLNNKNISHIEEVAYPEEVALDRMCISHLSSFNLTALTKLSSMIKCSVKFEFGIPTHS